MQLREARDQAAAWGSVARSRAAALAELGGPTREGQCVMRYAVLGCVELGEASKAGWDRRRAELGDRAHAAVGGRSLVSGCRGAAWMIQSEGSQFALSARAR